MEARLKNLTRSKWVSTVASIWIQCTSGTLYTFSVYSQTLKTTQGYDQSTLDTVSVFKDFGANCGILSGVLYSYSVSWAGPWVVLLAGAVQCFLGYFLMWAAVVGLIPRPPVVVMCLFMLLAAHAQSFFNTSNAVTGVSNFPYYKGTIVGIMKGFLGLSGAIIVQIYQIFMYEKTTSYLLMLALLPPINTLLLMWFVRIRNTKEGNEKQHLDSLSIIALVVAAYLMCIILLENFITLPLAIRVVGFVVLVLLLASPLCVVIRAHQGELDSVSEPFLTEVDRLEDGNDKRSLRSDIHLNLLQAMCTIDFWMLFIAMVCGMGSGLAVVNNLSQIGQSLGYRNFEISTLVSLLSIWNFFGRLGAGYISDCFLHRKGWARPLFMVITLASMSIGHVVIASGMPGALYTGSVLVGVCYGSQWSLMPTITSEIFGVLHMGTIFNAITIASPVGSYIFSVRVIGYIYDKEASEPENTCFGTQCFMLSFLIMAAATLFGALAALALFFRTRSFYSQDIDGNRNR
ncbi:putative major facilitator superfamily [Rosa chinensis]|uniref:Putative major facilitator superfamily n=1 Tax=Rosa chinensis TaxID=74649 RepID=A0A2P6P2C3_ROSCH|nr:protein NUCLEAR FUSION DEFECTIVE 4 [Rosa chinensis]PRQ16079.1 putative major facilitator superfamily [Rosa chinensis]